MSGIKNIIPEIRPTWLNAIVLKGQIFQVYCWQRVVILLEYFKMFQSAVFSTKHSENTVLKQNEASLKFQSAVFLALMSQKCMCNTVLRRWVGEQPVSRRSSKAKNGPLVFQRAPVAQQKGLLRKNSSESAQSKPQTQSSSEWNCITKWHLNRFRECSSECDIKPSGELFRVAFQLELLSDPKWPLRTRQQKDGKRKTKIMGRSQPYSEYQSECLRQIMPSSHEPANIWCIALHSV